MKTVLRGLVALISGVATFYSSFFLVLWIDGAQLPAWFPLVMALVACAIVVRYVWTRTASDRWGMITSIIMGALLVGGIGFIAGFLGPILFAPDNNLGPLLGIFKTGPLGLVVGGVAGWVYWLARR